MARAHRRGGGRRGSNDRLAVARRRRPVHQLGGGAHYYDGIRSRRPDAVDSRHRRGSAVDVYAAISDQVQSTLPNPIESGAPLTFLVTEVQPLWLRVLLPLRPNGSQGWIKRSEVTLASHRYRIKVELAAHRLTVTEGDATILETPVGVGTKDTPTPGGLYYTKELLQPPDQNGAYGHFTYGLSGFSNVLTNFAGGDGVIGIHGTNDPSTIGKDVSHGCLRISNAAIDMLAKRLPLGVPVEIDA